MAKGSGVMFKRREEKRGERREEARKAGQTGHEKRVPGPVDEKKYPGTEKMEGGRRRTAQHGGGATTPKKGP